MSSSAWNSRVKVLVWKLTLAAKNPKLALAHLFGKHYRWKEAPAGEGFNARHYPDYATYLRHQKEKVSKISRSWLNTYDERYRMVLRKRLEKDGVWAGQVAICLGARRGGEVRAFRDVGCSAFGIDLHPATRNPLLFWADFHFLPFRTRSVDLVFTNSLDHAYDLLKVIAEIQRVLKPRGKFIAELVLGLDEGYWPGRYESLIWRETDQVITLCREVGLSPETRTRIDFPYPGEHIVFGMSQGHKTVQ